MCVKVRGFKLYLTRKVYLHQSAAIEVSVFCVATNSPLGDFSYQLLCVIRLFFSTFSSNF